MFNSLIILFMLFFSWNVYADDSNAPLTISKNGKEIVLTPRDFGRLHVAKITVKDPVYGKEKHYAGYWLSDVLNLAGLQAYDDSEFIFTALDGYKARISQSDLSRSKANGFIAIADIDQEQGWEPFQHGKEMITPAPYYLVWDLPVDMPKDIQLPWPYQMVGISIMSVNQADDKVFPSGDKNPSVIRGYKVFSQNCLACHSVNLQGGVLGPELNIPKNILEYRQRTFLKTFIKDPNSFSAHNKMPAFEKVLSSDDIEDLLNYLDWMGKHKIPI